MMMQVRNTTDQRSKISLLQAARSFVSVFVPAEQALAMSRAVAVFLLIMGTVFGGGLASVMAYRDAAPGTLVYRAKLAIEQAQIMLAPNDAYRVRLHAEFADRRLDDAAKLAEGQESGRRLAVDVLESFNQELVNLRFGLLELKDLDPEGVAMAAKLLDRKMVAYQQVLKGVVQNLPVDVRPRALAVVDRVEKLSLQATAVLVEQYQAGDANASKSMVAHKIEDRILQAETQLTVSADKQPDENKTAQAKEAIAKARELLQQEDYQAAFSKMVEVVELAKEVETDQAEEEAAAAAAQAETDGAVETSNNEDGGSGAVQADDQAASEETNSNQTGETENKNDQAADSAKPADDPSAGSAGSGNR